MLANMDSQGEHAANRAGNYSGRAKNQIIEPKEPIHGPIEMQSGHQEISTDARHNEYEVMNQA